MLVKEQLERLAEKVATHDEIDECEEALAPHRSAFDASERGSGCGGTSCSPESLQPNHERAVPEGRGPRHGPGRRGVQRVPKAGRGPVGFGPRPQRRFQYDIPIRWNRWAPSYRQWRPDEQIRFEPRVP